MVPNPATGAYLFSKGVGGDRCVIAALKTQSSCLWWPWRGGEGKRRASDVGLALLTFLVKEFKIPVIQMHGLWGLSYTASELVPTDPHLLVFMPFT